MRCRRGLHFQRAAHSDLVGVVTQRDMGAASLVEMSVDKRNRDIEDRGEAKRVGRDTFVDRDRVVALDSPVHIPVLIATREQPAICCSKSHRSSQLTSRGMWKIYEISQ